MNDLPDDSPNAPLSGDDALESTRADAAGISSPGDGSEPIDIVDAEVVPDPRPERMGKQGAALCGQRRERRMEPAV